MTIRDSTSRYQDYTFVGREEKKAEGEERKERKERKGDDGDEE